MKWHILRDLFQGGASLRIQHGRWVLAVGWYPYCKVGIGRRRTRRGCSLEIYLRPLAIGLGRYVNRAALERAEA